LLAHIRKELLKIYPGMQRTVQRDALDRAVEGIWEEQLGLNNGEQKLVDREQMRARLDQLVEQYRTGTGGG
jgi:hypothetical protein